MARSALRLRSMGGRLDTALRLVMEMDGIYFWHFGQ
jgi:hypothetical protein